IISIMFFVVFSAATGFCVDSETTEDAEKSRIFLLPALMYSTDTGVGGGFAGIYSYYNPGSNVSTLEFAAIYTQKKQFTFSTRWQHHFHNNKSRIVNKLTYVKYPSLFFGMGNDTTNDDPEKFTPEFVVAEFSYERAIIKQLKIKTNFLLRNQAMVKTVPGGLLKTTNVPWHSGRFDAGPGIGILWDSRDNYLATKRGTLAQLEYLGLMFQNDGRSLNTVTLDVRHFRNPFSDVVFGSMFWMVDARGDIPFYLLSALGGQDRLRGYEIGRFLDRKLILFQQDMRFPVWGPIGGILFAATGRVSGKVEDLFSGQYHTAYGTGLRYFIDKKENLLVRFDLAFGSDSRSSYITFSEAF
ncbi:hypothetical protein ACFL6P_08960, partial [Candidatus Latescibacterota bacterium]